MMLFYRDMINDCDETMRSYLYEIDSDYMEFNFYYRDLYTFNVYIEVVSSNTLRYLL